MKSKMNLRREVILEIRDLGRQLRDAYASCLNLQTGWWRVRTNNACGGSGNWSGYGASRQCTSIVTSTSLGTTTAMVIALLAEHPECHRPSCGSSIIQVTQEAYNEDIVLDIGEQIIFEGGWTTDFGHVRRAQLLTGRSRLPMER